MADHGRITGLVTEVIFANDDTGYRVCEIEEESGDLVTAVGIMPNVSAGENLTCQGIWREHAVYGRQLEVTQYEKMMPKTRDAVERYLGSGSIKGIGPALAKRIVQAFGDETLEIIGREPERLAEVKGISLRGAMEIGAQLMEQTYLRDTMIFLQQYGISPALAMRIYKEFKEETIQTMRTNPYLLADRVRGIGFKRADEIARSMGIPPEAPERTRAAMKYILGEMTGEGHVYLLWPQLEDEVTRLTGADSQAIENALTGLLLDGEAVRQQVGEEERIYLLPYYMAEVRVARKIAELSGYTPGNVEGLPESIRAEAKAQGIELAPEQEEAILAAMIHGVLVITGGPGTGKTTIIKTLLSILESRAEEYVLAAPTGRAAKRMTEATGREAQTIHRLLEVNFQPGEDRTQQFSRNEDNPLEADVVIVDEVSMVDVLLAGSLLRAVPPGARLVLVGDVDQLPSVGPGSVLKDLIESECVPVVRLSRIFRQASESFIVTNAHRLLHGEHLVCNTPGTDFFLMKRTDLDQAAETLVETVKYRLPKYLKCSAVDDIQVLTPMRKTMLGAEQLNIRLQGSLNPPSFGKKELEFRQGVLREGDKVMQIRNNYNLPWEVTNQFGYALDKGQGVFNGDIGRIRKIDPASRTVTVLFDDRHEVEYDYSALEELELAYAVTIHKAQGTESPVIVLPLLGGPPLLFSRNLLYTAVTRARKTVVIVGSPEVVDRMIANDRPMDRNTSLCDRLRDVFGKNLDRMLSGEG